MESSQAHQSDDRWAVSIPEVARRLDISRATAYRLVANGDLPSIRLGRRRVVPIAVISKTITPAGAAEAVADAG
jgi:excisionase family DNA binding protein